MFQELKLIFQANVRVERYEVFNKFYSCKMEENSFVSEHILRMSGLRDMKSPTSYIAARWRRTVLSVNTYSKCMGIIIT